MWGWALFILSLGVNIGAAIAISRVLKKSERYDEFFETVQGSLRGIIGKMREIDIKGSFITGVDNRGAMERDDEISNVFARMKNLVDTLQIFITINTERDDG